jgi:hypothetical protein
LEMRFVFNNEQKNDEINLSNSVNKLKFNKNTIKYDLQVIVVFKEGKADLSICAKVH